MQSHDQSFNGTFEAYDNALRETNFSHSIYFLSLISLLSQTSFNYVPGIMQLGSSAKVNIVSAMHVTSLLPSITVSRSEHVISTTVPKSTGNCVFVSILPLHSDFKPVQAGAVNENLLNSLILK